MQPNPQNEWGNKPGTWKPREGLCWLRKEHTNSLIPILMCMFYLKNYNYCFPLDTVFSNFESGSGSLHCPQSRFHYHKLASPQIHLILLRSVLSQVLQGLQMTERLTGWLVNIREREWLKEWVCQLACLFAYKTVYVCVCACPGMQNTVLTFARFTREIIKQWVAYSCRICYYVHDYVVSSRESKTSEVLQSKSTSSWYCWYCCHIRSIFETICVKAAHFNMIKCWRNGNVSKLARWWRIPRSFSTN